MIQLSLPEALQHLHTVLQTVYEYLMVSVRLFFRYYRLDHAAADRIEPVDLWIRIAHGLIRTGMNVNSRLVQPDCQLLKSKDSVNCPGHPLVSGRLLLFGNTGTQKYHFYIRSVYFFDIASMGHHGRNYGSHHFCTVRVIFFDQIIYTGAACSNNIRHFRLADQFLILIGYKSGALGCLSYFRKSKLLQSIHHLSRCVELQHTCIGRRYGDYGTAALPQISLHPLQITGKCLGILGTDFQAAAAVDAVVNHDPCLFVSDRDGLHRAVAHTFVAVTAFCILKINDFHSGKSSLYSGKAGQTGIIGPDCM